MCAPRLGAYLIDAGLPVTIIDSDPRIQEVLPEQTVVADVSVPHNPVLEALCSRAATVVMDPPFNFPPQIIADTLDQLLSE